MTLTKITIGNPATYTLKLSTAVQTVHFTQPAVYDIYKHWENYFSNVDKVTVCLSGGLDSQLVANIAHRYCKDVEYVCFAWIYNNSVLNGDDISHANRFAQMLGVDLKVYDYHIEEALAIKNLQRVVEQAGTASPQLAVMMTALDTLDKSRTILLGGERPAVNVDEHHKVHILGCAKDSNIVTGLSKVGHTNDVILTYISTFMQYAHYNNINLIKDVFLLTPEIYYLSYYQWNKVINDSNYITQYKQGFGNYDMFFEKQLFYTSFDFDFVVPLHKKTGFENLQHFLASESGNYDQFDKLYRSPMIAYKQKLIVNKQVPIIDSKMAPLKLTGDYKLLFEELQKTVDEQQPTMHTIRYKYNW